MSADGPVIIPSNGDGYVELARTKQGRLFKKHLLSFGNLYHPATGKPIKIDEKFAATLKKNFDNGVCDIVQVPLANGKNEHTEDPERNIGEVVDLQIANKKIYAVIDVRDPKHADKVGKTYLGASAYLHLDYTDTNTKEKVGPTLLHSCVTNRPYVTGLENYEEVVAATSDRSDEEAVVLLTDDVAQETTEEQDMPEEKTTPETNQKPSLTELFESLKSDHGIDVPGLQAKAAESEASASMSAKLTEALTQAGLVKLSGGDDSGDDVSNEDVVGAVAELAQNNVTLTNRLSVLERERAETTVEKHIGEGRILPAKRDKMVELRLSNPSLYEDLLPADPIVKLNHEAGKSPAQDDAHNRDITADIEKYVKLSAELNGRK